MAKNRLVDSVNFAIEGLIHVLKSQRNMRLHFMFAVVILIFGIYINLTGNELLLILLSLTFLLCAEMFNTAIEFTVDLVSNSVHPLARIIKDVSAGAVLVSAINALVVCYVIFARRSHVPLDTTLINIRTSSWHITFIIFIMVLALVIVGKILLHSGTPLRGGMPSGHAAVAFSIWTIILFTTMNNFVVILTFILAFFVARSRIVGSIHSTLEVVSGSAIGILVTTIIFQILK
ncbi:MAG: diacylglycerol kinase [Candidatus Omnitrophica bacterium]|nr:diacylglycerol kinase [Candidatus Omnitrophota bacterium]